MPKLWDISTPALRGHLAEIAEHPNRLLVSMTQGLVVAVMTALIKAREKIETMQPTPFVDLVFEGPPGTREGENLVRVETEHAPGVQVGQALEGPNGQWVMRIGVHPSPAQWQPIETAPRDGSHVLLYVRDHGIHIGRLEADLYAKRPRPYWQWSDLWGLTTQRAHPPSHWMPLPASPSPVEHDPEAETARVARAIRATTACE